MRTVLSTPVLRRPWAAMVAVLLVAALTVAVAPERSDAALSCSAASTNASSGHAAARRPVILVHGWRGNKNSLVSVGNALANRISGQVQVFSFDYGANSTTWAGDSAVSGCLAQYVNAVSAGHRAVGGDGAVILVGHSMGGLASLYASAETARIGGVVTLGTPFLGSPFGNTLLGAALEIYTQLNGVNVPPVGSSAQVCLGEHSDGSPLPAGCAYGLPPYLPVSVPLTAVAGSVVLRRTFGPIHLYDIQLGSDGIVPKESAHGYLFLKPRSSWPRGAKITLLSSSCTIDGSLLKSVAKKAGWAKFALDRLDEGIGLVYGDNNALDGILEGRLTPGLVALLGAATIEAGCSHINLPQDQAALTHIVEAVRSLVAQLKPPAPTNPPTSSGGSSGGGSSGGGRSSGGGGSSGGGSSGGGSSGGGSSGGSGTGTEGGGGGSSGLVTTRLSGPAGFWGWASGFTCPNGSSVRVDQPAGTSQIPESPWPGLTAFRYDTSPDRGVGTYPVRIRCTVSGAIVREYSFSVTITGPARQLAVTGTPGPGKTLVVSDGGGCGPWSNGKAQRATISVYVPFEGTLLATKSTAVGADGRWGPVSITLPGSTPDRVLIGAFCKTDGDDSSFEWMRLNARYYSGYDYPMIGWPN